MDRYDSILTPICILTGGDISRSDGPSRVRSMATAFNDRGYDIHIVAPEPSDTLSDVYDPLTVHTVPALFGRFHGQFARAVTLSRQASGVCKKQDAILLVNQASLAGVASLVTSVEMVVDMADIAFPSPVYAGIKFESAVRQVIRLLERRATENAELVFTASKPLSNFITSEWGVEPDRAKTIYNGYFKSDLDWTADGKSTGEGIGYISGFGPKSDVDRILSLAVSTSETITVIGDGMKRDRLENKVRQKGITNIDFKGFLPYKQAMQELRACRVGIIPLDNSLSTRLSCPVKTFDYAMAECAIVGDCSTEIIRMLASENAALCSDPENKEEFIQNVLKVLNDDQIYRTLTSNAKSIVQEQFSREYQGQRAVDRYEHYFT